jgi:chemotaxis protein CheX
MNEKYVKSFVDSAINIIYSMTAIHIYQDGEIVQNSPFPEMQAVAILIGITGQLKGRVIILMNPQTALEIATIMNNEIRDQFDELTISTLTELANIIIGHAITNLNREGLGLDLTPPTLLMGKNIQIKDDKLDSWIVNLNFKDKKIIINLALKDA